MSALAPVSPSISLTSARKLTSSPPATGAAAPSSATVDNASISAPPPDEVTDLGAGAQGAHLDGERQGIPAQAEVTVDPNTGATVSTFQEEGVTYRVEERWDGESYLSVTTYEQDGVLYTETIHRDPEGWTEEHRAQTGDVVAITSTTCTYVEGDFEDYYDGNMPVQAADGERGQTRELVTTMTVSEPDGQGGTVTTELGRATTYVQQIDSVEPGGLLRGGANPVPVLVNEETGPLNEEASGQFVSVTTMESQGQTTVTVGAENRAVWISADGTPRSIRISLFETQDGEGQPLFTTRTDDVRGFPSLTWFMAETNLGGEGMPNLMGEIGEPADYRSTSVQDESGSTTTVEEFGALNGQPGSVVRSVDQNGHSVGISLHRPDGSSQTWVPGTGMSIVEQADGKIDVLYGEERITVSPDGRVIVQGEEVGTLELGNIEIQEGETPVQALFRELGTVRSSADLPGIWANLPDRWQGRLNGFGGALAVYALMQRDTYRSLEATASSLGSLLGELAAMTERFPTLNRGVGAFTASRLLGGVGAALTGVAAAYDLYQGDYRGAALNGAAAVGAVVVLFNPVAGALIIGGAILTDFVWSLFEEGVPTTPVLI